VELIVCHNYRDKNGVLVVSNLSRLSEAGLAEVQVLHRSCEFIQRMIHNGQTDCLKLTSLVYEFVVSFKNFKLLKIQFLDAYTLADVRFMDNSKKILIQIEGELEGLYFCDNMII